MDKEMRLFKMAEMKPRKHSRNNETKNITEIDVSRRANVHLSDMYFKENIVSRIEIFRFECDDSDKSYMFVQIFMGNIEIAYQIFYSDVVIETEYAEDVHGNKYIRSFHIREARNYDYQ
ncbi:hypothetical protein [Maledivibacter halophilus]|uniref:Uncharacterized protein n=1 Tax=Maledivibacter halophilus TaxID=36842 RepID=A0A1T5KDZ4_9FIRM|nr:hypothetical protein [Maledivibacter halophilus]SKC61887.1 hypothetical protein SAMN02194393_01721 [Maledivibacter halophilus]